MCWVICGGSSCIIYGVNSMSKYPGKIVKILSKKKTNYIICGVLHWRFIIKQNNIGKWFLKSI